MPSQPNARRPEKVLGHPGIYQKGNRYIDTWKDDLARSRSRSYRTLSAAVRGRAERIANGNQPLSRERFDRYARRWVESYQGRTKRGLTASSRDDYRRTLEQYAIPYFRHKPLGDIDVRLVKRFIEHLKSLEGHRGQPLAPSTIRWIMTPLKALLADAYEEKLIPVDPGRVRIIIADRESARRPRTLTPEQLAAILNALPARYRLLFTLLSKTGLRISEALGLQWRDLEQTAQGPVLVVCRQFYRGKLYERTKSDAGYRRVALVPSLARELTRQRTASEYAGDTDPIFATAFGTHISAHNIRRVLRPIVEDLDIPWATPHTFRHSLATRLRDIGHDAIGIASVLGHSDPSFTQRVYIHGAEVVRFDELDEDNR